MPLSQSNHQIVRNWAWDQFPFGEWFPKTEIRDFIRDQFGYKGSTPEQCTSQFLTEGVKRQDFELRANGKEWRWIDHASISRGKVHAD